MRRHELALVGEAVDGGEGRDREPQLEEHGFKKVPRKTARHHLTWLAQQRICGMSCEAIAERYAKENPRLESPPSAGAVAKAIRRTVAMIELD